PQTRRAARSVRISGRSWQSRDGGPRMENVVRVLSTLALMGAVRSLAGGYQAETGVRIDADYAPTLGLLHRLRGGDAADVVILTREGLDGLAGLGTVVADSRIDL